MSFSNTNITDKPADPYKAANKDETSLETKVEGLVNLITTCKFGMMTTHEANTDNLVSRCMALAATETAGIDLIFHTNTESGKTDDLAADSHVNMSFLNGSGEWASVSGQATVITDREIVKKYYSPQLKAWVGDLGDGKHDGSENDPRIGVIRIKMNLATYALVSKNIISRAADVVQGAITGKVASVNMVREIAPSDVKSWRSTHAV